MQIWSWNFQTGPLNFQNLHIKPYFVNLKFDSKLLKFIKVGQKIFRMQSSDLSEGRYIFCNVR
jgi:hypothetical protein